ncbi:homoserine dehydrogenase [Jeotgalibaca sp. MA1X17-3]|uniref:homoserine dehydrogenase n=1 Tax=Jeotgalibaca sp. MA1X17-3 TaxID=2908211 RepID=UPI001F199A06|nr:homoserine dehydrogenase [Jeotgalibaca sp. MA1X17-3]UJF15140.1 homoserine dehydrogenase [Jeotgalibaca sp. MA1X17-3]
MGIINGTSNFMLTKMKEDHLSYEEALEMAQNLGFAESDPTADVKGIDAARKIIILTQLAFGKKTVLEEMDITGITHIQSLDFSIAEQLDGTIKLVALSEIKNGKIWTEVAPMFVSLEHPLAFVKNENNAVYVKGEAVGETMFYGPGAGRFPTANSVVSDIISLAKDKNRKIQSENPVFQSQTTKLENNGVFSNIVIRFKGKEEADKETHYLLDRFQLMGWDATSLSTENDSTKNVYITVKDFPREKWIDLENTFSLDPHYRLEAIFSII